MAFAVFYNRQDLLALVAALQRQHRAPADRQFAQSVLNASASTWDSAPTAPPERQEGDPDTRILVIDGTHKGHPITLAQFRDFTARIGLAALAKDMGGPSGAVEPWPPA